MTSRKRLGRGLDVLLGGRGDDSPAAADAAEIPYAEVAIDALAPGTYQPRDRISDASVQELAESIRQRGVLQPLVVRERGERRRRFRSL